MRRGASNVRESNTGVRCIVEGDPKFDDEGAHFDGIYDYIVIPKVVFGGQRISYEFLAKWDAFNSWSRIFDFGNGQTADNVFFANYGTGKYVSSQFYKNTGANAIFYENLLQENKWMHFVVTSEDTTDSKTSWRLYLDGAQRKLVENKPVTPYITREKNYIAESNWAANGFFEGSIAFIRVYQGTTLTSK